MVVLIFFKKLPNRFCLINNTESLKSMDTGKHFQNGLPKLVEIWHTVIEVFKFYHVRCFLIF
jgi:hypothetical protein